MNNVVPLLPGDKVKIFSRHLPCWGVPNPAMTHLYMKMLTNRNALFVKLNLITMTEQTIKVSANRQLFGALSYSSQSSVSNCRQAGNAIFTALAKTCSTCP